MRFRIWESNKSGRKQTDDTVDYVFNFAEHLLIVGVFAFLAESTGHWAVILIAATLAGLLVFKTLSAAQSLHFTHWKEGDGKWMRAFWGAIDLVIFVIILAVCWIAFSAVRETMSGGIGV